MSRIQNGKNRNPDKPISGCLGRMVNLFDLNTGIGGNRLLTDKPHHDKTPIKMLIAEEMSKEDDCKQSPSNLVAKLMGLDALPQHHHQQQQRHSRSQSGSMEFSQQEHESKHEITKCQNQEQEECKDVYEIWQQQQNHKIEGKMDLIREKFMEAKRLSTDEKLRKSKQFQDALEVLSSNKDMFLKFLQEPNSLFSQHLYNLQSLPPPPDSRRITVLRPSKLLDSQSQKKNKTGSDFIFSPESCKIDENPSQPTRIVILKPQSTKVLDSHDDVFDGDPEDKKDENIHSSVFSNGYIGDESSFCKSEIENLSDSEEAVSVLESPTSRHSWDYINRFNSHYATSSSHASYSQESSVCREAKKRLSERWAMMASNKNVPEQQIQIQRSSSTLGDMLALSDLKEGKKSEIKEEFMGPGENDNNTPRNLPRSKSVPASSSSLEEKGDDSIKEKLVKSSSFKGRVSSLFFSKNKKSGKEKSNQSKDVGVPQSATSLKNEGSECVNNDMIVEEKSSTRLHRKSQGIILPEAGFSFKKGEIGGNVHSENQDQPSPISVLEPQFEEDDHAINSHRNLGVDPMKYNLIDKSPPIGSISRTLSWDDSNSTTLGSSTPYLPKPSSSSSSSSSAPLTPQEEEQECLFFVQTLLSLSGLTQSNSLFATWHSPESPLDPTLRDKYMNQTEKEDSVLTQTKQRRIYRSMSKLVFDCVNEALMDIGNGPHVAMMTSASVGDRVWGRMKEWLFTTGEERWGEWEEVVVEEVVRKEVVGPGWVLGVKLESDVTRRDIEGKLLEELVEESVLELTGRL